MDCITPMGLMGATVWALAAAVQDGYIGRRHQDSEPMAPTRIIETTNHYVPIMRYETVTALPVAPLVHTTTSASQHDFSESIALVPSLVLNLFLLVTLVTLVLCLRFCDKGESDAHAGDFDDHDGPAHSSENVAASVKETAAGEENRNEPENDHHDDGRADQGHGNENHADAGDSDEGSMAPLPNESSIPSTPSEKFEYSPNFDEYYDLSPRYKAGAARRAAQAQSARDETANKAQGIISELRGGIVAGDGEAGLPSGSKVELSPRTIARVAAGFTQAWRNR